MRGVISTLCLLAAAVNECFACDLCGAINIQLLYGRPFHDPYFGANTVSGQMGTVTAEHLVSGKWGDSFSFLDLMLGDMANFSGQRANTVVRGYAEWQPRLSLSKLLDRQLTIGPVRQIYWAQQFNLGQGYRAGMTGIGVDLGVKGFESLGVNTYLRIDNINRPTSQTTVFWSMPIPLGRVRGHFQGYADVVRTDRVGIDIGSQPALLFDLNARSKHPRLKIGVEFFYHQNTRVRTAVFQPTLMWTW